MKLINWHVSQYKSIEEGNFSLDDFTILIGRNNAGKSNIISSLHDFKDYHSNKTKRNGTPENWLTERVTGKQEGKSVTTSLQFKLSESVREKMFDQIEESYNSTRHRQMGVPSPEAMFDDDWMTHIKYKVQYNPDTSVNVSKYVNYKDEYKDLGALSGSNEVYGANFNGIINSAMGKYLSTWNFLNPFREPENTQNPSYDINLQSNGSNLVQVLESLQSDHRNIFSKISDTYVDIMDGVSDLRVQYDQGGPGHSKTIVVEEEKYEIKFKSEDISSGSKEILVLLTQVFLAEEFANLLVLEEPELHVHPEAENKIYSILNEIVSGDGPQIIVSTHSDVFVNQSDVSNIVRVERDGDTTLRTVSEGEIEQELAELGYDKSGLLQSEAVVFVEGRSDKRILKKFADTLDIELESQGIKIVELEGIDNMKRDAKSLVKLLYSFDIPYLFLIDKHDQTVGETCGDLYEAMKRDDNQQWWDVSMDRIKVWDAYGIESYLLVPRAIADGFEMSENEVQDIVENNEDEADKEKVLKKIYAEENSDLDEPEGIYTKDQHGMEIAKRMVASETDEEVVEVMDQISELASN